MPQPLHIIEPTLASKAGHCYSLVRALAGAASACDVTVWAGRSTALEPSFWPGPGRLVPHFRRRWRRPQAFLLYRRLLREPGRILVATAGTADLVMADLAASGRIPPRKLYCFFHWLNAKPGRQRRLEALARRQPDVEILAPTESVGSFFRSCGFRATVVGYPVETPDAAPEPAPAAGSPAFRHLLVAGGARLDKGIDRVVDLVEELQRRRLHWPIVVQSSVEPRHGDDAPLARELARLAALTYGGLSLRGDTPDADAYRAMFDGAVVLQPYRAEDFRDRVSGVTLDALGAGAPVIVTEGTWMARLVSRFGAGIAVSDLSPAGLLHAIERLLADYPGYAARARLASATLREEHSSRGLMAVVMQPD